MGAFAKFRESSVPPMLERLKERKANVTDAIGAALDAIFVTVCNNQHTDNFMLIRLCIDEPRGHSTRCSPRTKLEESSSERGMS